MTSFHQMTVSTAWQPVTLGAGSYQAMPLLVWNWVKPVTFANGLVYLIPPETFQHPQAAQVLTVRQLLIASGLNPASCWQWFYLGQMYEGMGGTNPLLDYPLPPSTEGIDPHVYVTFVVDTAPAAMPVSTSASSVLMAASIAPQAMLDDFASVLNAAPAAGADFPTGELEVLFRNIENDWKSIYHLEKNLGIARKQLDALMGRLNGLNKDLSPEERNSASQLEQKEWQDVRRRLRDLQTNISRLMKEHDMGITSAAGKRTYFEQIYQDYVLPRIPFEGLRQAYRDIEMHRKMLSNLQNQINTVMQKAQQDGEARAQLVLRRIQDSVRAGRAKR